MQISVRRKHFIVYYIFFIALIFCNKKLQAQQVDSNYILRFSKTNVIEIYPSIYSTRFHFSSPGEHKNDYSLAANSNAHISTNISYKWLTLRYSWAMPGTQLDKNVKLNYTSLMLNLGDRQMRFRPFYDSYNGLLIPGQKKNDSFTLFRGIQYTDAGFDYYFFTNTHLFSFSAARSFSVKQIKSAGSVFLMVTPSWQKINWKEPSRALLTDSATYTLLSQDPEWISLIARIGYTYNFVLQKGKWIIAPAAIAGAGLLKKINASHEKLQPVTNMQAWLNAGYNGPNYYCYFHAAWNNLQTNLLIKNMNQVNTSLSITAGFRFHNFKKKIFGFI